MPTATATLTPLEYRAAVPGDVAACVSLRGWRSTGTFDARGDELLEYLVAPAETTQS